MTQTLHIFEKDVRYLYREGALLVALAVVFAGVQTLDPRGTDASSIVELLMALTATFTIARVVQADPIPGDSQFWVTRPYRWQSLLAAKLLFILTFINLPILVAQIFILRTFGFPIAANCSGLLWCQLLILFAVELPIATLGSLTRTMTAFLPSALLLALVGAGLVVWHAATSHMPGPLDWIAYSVALLAAALMLPPLLYLQYKNRRTQIHRRWGLGAAGLVLAALVAIPWPALFAVQSKLSKQAFDFQVKPDSDSKVGLFADAGKQIYVYLPAIISELPVGYRAQFEDFTITLRGPDGRSMQLNEGKLSTDYQSTTRLSVRGRAPLAADFLQAAQNQPLSLHATFYVTVLGNAHGESFPIPDAPRSVSDGLQCYANSIDDLVCRSAFRLPAASIDVKSWAGASLVSAEKPPEQKWSPFTHSDSYSPFPSTLRLNPIKLSEPYFLLPNTEGATLVLEEPLAYLRRDFEIQGVRITRH